MDTRAKARSQRSLYSREVVLLGFVFIVLGHWAEHLVQAFQYFVLDRPAPRALGALGSVASGAAASEWLHMSYNAGVLAGIALLRSSFAGRSRAWWNAALLAQGWHVVEHTLLITQAIAGLRLFGASVPTSIGQLVVPRLELHLLYNAIVTAFIVAGFAARRRTTPRVLPV